MVFGLGKFAGFHGMKVDFCKRFCVNENSFTKNVFTKPRFYSFYLEREFAAAITSRSPLEKHSAWIAKNK